MSDWFYAKDNDQKGPINESELKTLLANNQLPPHTLVWKEGMANWTAANQVPNFTFRPPPLTAKSKSDAPPLPASGSTTIPSLASFSIPRLPPVGEPVAMDEADVEKNKIFGILAYLWVLFLVPLLAASDSPFAKYHANQGLVLFLVWLVIAFVVTVVNIILAWIGIPFIGAILFLLYPLHLVLVVLGIVNAANGKAAPLPIIGGIQLIK